MAVSIDAQAAINEIARDLDRGVGRSRDDVTPVGWYGEDETYGTQADWLTGEGLTSAWGTDPGWGIRSTYSNPVSEYLGEDPLANIFVDAKGMLQRGGKPSGWDYANLALSAVPVVGPAVVRSPIGVATKKAIQGWLENSQTSIATALRGMQNKARADKYEIDFYTRLSDDSAEFKDWADSFRTDLAVMKGKMEDSSKQMWDDLGVSLGKSPEEMQAMRSKALKDLELQKQGVVPLEDAKTKAFRQKFNQAWDDAEKKQISDALGIDLVQKQIDDVALFSPTERALYEFHMKEGKTASEALELTLDAITETQEIVDDWLPGFKKSMDDNLKDWATLKKTTTELPENVTQLGVAKPIQDMTWREWDNLSDETLGIAHGKVSAKQQDIMRAQGITNPDNILDHFWGKGARKEFVTGLEQNSDALTVTAFEKNKEFVRTRDLKTGYTSTMTEKQFKSDIAWKDSIADFKIVTEEVPVDPIAVAEKMAFKPDKVTHGEWARLTEDLTREEAINLARRMTLRLID